LKEPPHCFFAYFIKVAGKLKALNYLAYFGHAGMRFLSGKDIQECAKEFAVLNIQYDILVIPFLKHISLLYGCVSVCVGVSPMG